MATGLRKPTGERAYVATDLMGPSWTDVARFHWSCGSAEPDLGRAWSHPAATAATRKRIMRACLNEIVVRKEGTIIRRHRGTAHRARRTASGERWRNMDSSSSLIVPFIPSYNRSLGWRGS
jgi:hypothetical protein